MLRHVRGPRHPDVTPLHRPLGEGLGGRRRPTLRAAITSFQDAQRGGTRSRMASKPTRRAASTASTRGSGAKRYPTPSDSCPGWSLMEWTRLSHGPDAIREPRSLGPWLGGAVLALSSRRSDAGALRSLGDGRENRGPPHSLSTSCPRASGAMRPESPRAPGWEATPPSAP